MATKTLIAETNGGLAFAENGANYEGAVDIGAQSVAGAVTADTDVLLIEQGGSIKKIVVDDLVDGGVYRATFTSASLINDILTLGHNFGVKVVTVTVADNSDKIVVPTDIMFKNTTQLDIDFTGLPVTGTWSVVVRR